MNDASERSSARGRRRAIAAGLLVMAAAVLLLLRLVGGDDDRSSLGDSSLDDAIAASNSRRGVSRRPLSPTTVAASPEPTSRLTWLAVDDRTSEPIRDVLAYLTAWRTSSLQPAGTPIAAQSDAGGIITLERRMLELAWSRGESLTVWKEGYLPVAVESAPATSPAEIRLQPAESLVCRVVDLEDRPIAGAIVTVSPDVVWDVVPADFGGADFRLPAASPGVMLRIAKSDGAGQATIHGLKSGVYRFLAVHAGYVIDHSPDDANFNKIEFPRVELRIRMQPLYAAVALPHGASGRFVEVRSDRYVLEFDSLSEVLQMPIKKDLATRAGEGAAVSVRSGAAALNEDGSAGDADFTWMGADGEVRTTRVPLVPIESVVPIVLGAEIDTAGGVVTFEPMNRDGSPMGDASIRLSVSSDDVDWRGGPLIVDSTARVDLPAGRYRVTIADRLIKHAFETETFLVSAGETTKVTLRAKIALRRLSLKIDENLAAGLRPARRALGLYIDDATTRQGRVIDCRFGECTIFHLAVGFRGSWKCASTGQRRWSDSLVVEEGNGTIDLTPAFRRAFLGDSHGASQNRPSELPKSR